MPKNPEPTTHITDVHAEMKAAQLKYATLQAPLLGEALASISDDAYFARVKAARDALPSDSPAYQALSNVMNSITAHQNTLRHYIQVNDDLVKSSS